MHAEFQTDGPLPEIVGISNSFPGVQALEGVDRVAYPGEVHVVVGENGAGKSTLMMVLAGAYLPDRGTLRLADTSIRLGDSASAQQAGIGMVYQELSLFPEMSIAENVLAGRQPTRRLGWIDTGRLRQQAVAVRGIDVGAKAWNSRPHGPACPARRCDPPHLPQFQYLDMPMVTAEKIDQYEPAY